MNILVLNGSPKCENSNTLKINECLFEGISERTAANIEILNVSKLNIHDCQGMFLLLV